MEALGNEMRDENLNKFNLRVATHRMLRACVLHVD